MPSLAAFPVIACVYLCVCLIQFTKVGGVDVELCGHTLPAESDADPDDQPRVQLICKVTVSALRWLPLSLAQGHI